MRKILQFSIASTKGGRTQYILNNWNNIDRERFRFDFLTFDARIDFAEELEDQGCRIFYMPCRPQENVKLFREALGRVLEKRYDTLHISTEYWNGFEIEEIAKAYHVPQVIIHAHSSGYQKAVNETEKRDGQEVHYRMRRLLNENMATDFLACSNEAAEWVFGNQIAREKIKIMPNAIDTYKFAFSVEKRQKARMELGLAGKFAIGHVGRIELVKNHQFLINTFSKVVERIPNAALVLVGDGKLRGQVEEQIKKLSLQDRVKVLGKRDDADFILQAMDVFLLPSLFEGFPIALVEAQTAGLPCIVSDLITKEAAITQLVNYCPLVMEKWVDKLEEVYAFVMGEDEMRRKKQVRKNMQLEVTSAGYEIRNQIKELEKLYERT